MNEDNHRVRRVNPQSIILIIVISVCVGILILLQTKDSPIGLSGNPIIQQGVAAPDFTLPNLKGEMVSMADYKGKVVLLNIWATWCEPCVAEMPSMEKLYQALRGESFEILAVSVDLAGAEIVAPFMKTHNLSFPALMDTNGLVKSLYQTTGVPESFIIGKDGVILQKIIGPRDWAAEGVIGHFRTLIQNN